MAKDYCKNCGIIMGTNTGYVTCPGECPSEQDRGSGEGADVEYMGDLVLDAARTLFKRAGYSEDFCIQNVGSSAIIFGGSNRVIWHPLSGFRVDAGYCSTGFIQNFKKAMREYK